MDQIGLFGREVTLREAREKLRRQFDNGTTCPCCDQGAKRYPRKLHSMIARGLVELYRQGGAERFVDVLAINRELRRRVPDTVNPTSDFSKIEYWRLAYTRHNDDTQRRSSGLWRLTPRGINFVRGECSVPVRAYVYNNHVDGYSEDTTTIRAALGDRFDYEELMGAVRVD